MRTRAGWSKLVATREWSAALAALLLAGCGSDDGGGLAFSQLGDEVEPEGWVDSEHPLVGDGATSFESFRRSGGAAEYVAQNWNPYFNEQLGFDAGPLTSVVGEHLLSLTRFRGLVSTRLTGADAPRVDASVPLGGLPVGLTVSEGVAAVIVVDPQKPGCVLGDCIPRQTSRVVLVSVEDPANPRLLEQQRFDGTVLAARQVGGTLHVLSQDIGSCDHCEVLPRSNLTWLSFDRRVPTELPAPRAAALGKDAFFGEERLVSLAEGASLFETVLRVADLSQPEPALSAPVTLAGRVQQARASGDRLRVRYESGTLDIETFALDAAAPASLGRGTVAPPDADDFSWLTFDGDRAVATLAVSRQLVVLDLSDPAAPRAASSLALDLSSSELALAGDRVLAVGRSTLASDGAPDGVTPLGPVALVLVDVADLASPRLLDRATLGSVQAVHVAAPDLRDGRALVTISDPVQGGSNLDGPCGRVNRQLVGYDISAGRLAPAVAFEGLDADARLEVVGDDWWLASSVSVSRYGTSSAAPSARVDLTRRVDRLQALSGSLALFGADFATNAPTFELVPPAAAGAAALDVSAALGLAGAGCDERRQWLSPLAERDDNLYALRLHRLTSEGPPAAATLHTFAAGTAASPSPVGSLELEPLAAGDRYLGAVQTERALLIARTRANDSGRPTGDDPSVVASPSGDSPWEADYGEYEQPAATLGYDVIDLSDPSRPALASRLDIEPALAKNGFFHFMRGLTRDGAGGFLVDGAIAGPEVVSGSVLAGHHSELASNGRVRFYLDRFDLSQPRAPLALGPVEIPGSVLDFDAATGGLITLEAMLFPEPIESERCEGFVNGTDEPTAYCPLQRRALNGLVVGGEGATRLGRVLIDSDEREALRLAVSSGVVYYVTQPAGATSERGAPFAARDIILQRVRLRDGRFERLASFDISGASNLSPKLWTQFAARDDRALWVSGGQLMVADFRSPEPRLEVHDLGAWGCSALALRGDTAYCARGDAGYVAVTLGEP